MMMLGGCVSRFGFRVWFQHDVVRGLCVLVLVLEILCFVLLMMVGALCSMVVSVCFLNFVVGSEDDMEFFFTYACVTI